MKQFSCPTDELFRFNTDDGIWRATIAYIEFLLQLLARFNTDDGIWRATIWDGLMSQT